MIIEPNALFHQSDVKGFSRAKSDEGSVHNLSAKLLRFFPPDNLGISFSILPFFLPSSKTCMGTKADGIDLEALRTPEVTHEA